MSAIGIHCDEDVDSAIWRGLRRIGIAASSVAEEAQFASTDGDLLKSATLSKRVLLTHNVQDFPRIHAHIMSRLEHHTGIIIASRIHSVGEIIRRVARLCATVSAEEMQDRLEYLGSW